MAVVSPARAGCNLAPTAPASRRIWRRRADAHPTRPPLEVARAPPGPPRPPAEIGTTLDEVDTPALIVDLDAFERNLRRLPERIGGTGVRARPHAKTHKCPVIALKQVALGAVGVCG